ncbi:MAG: 4-hydroxythreonine-4-phosphate dehydrogenase PdxA [Rhodospirillales bacterium]
MTGGRRDQAPPALPPLALTMGEPAGIGGELSLRAWLARRQSGPVFFVLDDSRRLSALARRFHLDVPVQAIDSPSAAAKVFANALPVLQLDLDHAVELSKPSPGTANTVIDSIRRAVALTQNGEASAVVTNPIQKSVLYGAGFGFPGHTEFLLDLAGGPQSGHSAVMMLASPDLRVVPVSVHLPLRQAIAELSAEAIVAASMVCHAALRRDFGIANPRLAVAGLNPHAGEDGSLGDEELRIVAPAIANLRARGIDASGPWVPDTMFHAGARPRYDAAICLYHDQALIPLKTLDFHGGVNVTLGLPFVRTSPDHGTALDIATQGKAEPASLLAAIDLAGKLAANRAAAPKAKPGA